MKDGTSARIYVLLDYKAQADARPPAADALILQLWMAESESGERPLGRLSLIIPMVFFHSRGPWSVPRSITEMIKAPAGLGHLARNLGDYILHDVSNRAPEDLSRRADAGRGLLALAKAFVE